LRLAFTPRAWRAKLLEAGVIDDELAFRIDARLQGRLEGLKAGEYQFCRT